MTEHMTLDYDTLAFRAKHDAKNVTCIPMEKATRDLNASDGVFLPLDDTIRRCNKHERHLRQLVGSTLRTKHTR